MTKTLKLHDEIIRNVRYSATRDEDITAYYKAYQMGAFAKVAPQLSIETELTKEEFVKVFVGMVQKNNLLSITFFAKEEPIGIAFFWRRLTVLEIAHVVWFPWATRKSVFESFLNFFDGVRHTKSEEFESYFQVVEFAREDDEKFFDKFVELGILQKVGKMQNCSTHENDSAVIYATLKPKEQ